MNWRMIICSCVVALLPISLFGADPVAAALGVQKSKVADGSSGHAHAIGAPDEDEALNVPIMVLYRGYGFAFKGVGEEIRTLRILIFRQRSIDPPYIRGLLEGAKSIEEIRGELIEKGWAATYRGDLQFAGAHYTLTNITLKGTEDNLTIDADIMSIIPHSGVLYPRAMESGERERAGTIMLTLGEHEGMKIGRGRLILRGEEYRVVLELLPLAYPAGK